jgi:hypothetical protein
MPQSSNTNILPIYNPKLSQKSESSSYNWKTLTKASLVFATTTGAFLALKTTGSFNLIASLWKNSPSETDLDESSVLANFNNPSEQTYTIPVNEEQPFIAHQYAKRQPSANEAVIKIGPEFQVNTYTDNEQGGSSVATLSDDKFIITWHCLNQDGNNYGAYGQLFYANGTKFASEFPVNTHTTSAQWYPSVRGLNDGKFIITWTSLGQDGDSYGIYGQLFNANGTKFASEFPVNTHTTNWQLNSSVAGLNDGKFVIAWESVGQDGDSYGIYGQLFNANGTRYASEFPVNTYITNDQRRPSVAKLNDGNFVITWYSVGQDGSSASIYGQLFKADGAKFASEFPVNTYTIGEQSWPSIAGLSDSKFVITWHSQGQDGDSYGIYGQLFNANGTKFASEFQINICTINNQEIPSAIGLSNGKFVVTWMSHSQDGSEWGIYGQAFNADGSKYASEFQVNTYTTNIQSYPSIAGLINGKFVATWSSQDQDNDAGGIYGQLFKVDTAPILVNNNLTIGKGETVTLTTNNLSTTDVDDDDATLTFTVSNVQHGQFELKSNPGTPITSFTQQQIIDGNIQFVHDGSDIAPTYQVNVGDEWLTTDSTAVAVTFGNRVPIGSEFQVNTYTAGDQDFPSVTKLSDGKFVVTWQGRDGDSYGICGQIFNANSTKFLSEFKINTYTTDMQWGCPPVAGLNDGKFVVTWMSNGQDGSAFGIYGQMYNADGSKYSSEFRVNTQAGGNQNYPSVTRLNDGKFVVTWQSDAQDGSLYGVYGQMYNANGTRFLSEFQVNTYTTDVQRYPSVAGLIDGKFVVTWDSYGQDGSYDGVYGQMYNANGTGFLSEFRINSFIGNFQWYPSVTKLNDGKFVVTWESCYGQDGNECGIYSQIYNADGNKYLSEFQVNTYTTNSQEYPSVAGLSDGKFVVTWQSRGQDGDSEGIYGQIYNGDGTRFLSEFRVNTYTSREQSKPSVAGLSDGKFVVTWTSGDVFPPYQDGDMYGIYGQMFNVNTAPTIVNNNLIITKDETVTLTTNNLSATDVDDDDTALAFTVSNLQYGQFELKSNPGTPITSFSQQQIIDGNVQFVHDGSINSPSYDVAVSDESLSTSPVPAIVTFSLSESLTSSSKSKAISSSLQVSQSAIQSESSTSTSRSTSKPTISDSLSSTKSEVSSVVSTFISSSEFGLSSESKTPSSSPSTTESVSSMTSKSEAPSSTSSAYQSTMQSRTSESASKSTSNEVSSTQALSDSSKSTTTSTGKSFLGAILGSIGGVVSTIGTIFGIWLKYKKYRAIIKLRQQSPLAAEVQKYLNLDVSDFQSKLGQKYVAVINGIVEALQKQGTPVDKMDKKQLHDLTLSSVEVIKKKVEPNKTFLRKTIPVKGLKNAKDSIIKGVINKYVKGKNKNGIMLQSIKSEEANIEENVYESGGKLFGVKDIQRIQLEDLNSEGKIGDGSFGDVYKAKWQGSDVAVKVLKEGIVDLPEFMGDFIREAATWSKLTHPNITQFFGICWTKPSPYIVVEYVGGGSLASHLKKKDLSLVQRLGLGLDTIRGLKYLHEYNPSILHRDIKPDNILVEYNWNQSNEQWLLRGKLTDFGSARQKVIDQVEKKQQKLTKGVGTPVYQAPEIMKGNQNYSEKADIYSVGICLCEIYTQQEPYSDHPELTTQFKLCKAIIDGVRPAIPDEMPKGYAKLIKKCWSERSDKRPNAKEVEQQLNTIVDEHIAQECSVTMSQ